MNHQSSLCLNPSCNQANDINDKFCQYCGNKIILRERYQAVKVIGKGGFGRTFLAIDQDKPSQPYCVIKQFFPAAQETQNLAKAADLFALEAKRLEQLGNHDQIPDLLAYFTHDDQRQYLVQQYIEGRNLLEELKTQGPFNEKQIRSLLIDLLTVLKYIHSKQVIHRDIKPENIIRRVADQKLVLVDFGAAKHATPAVLGVTGTVIGSQQYWAPEQSKGKPDFPSDLYSLGVTCLHLITGTEPSNLHDVYEDEWVWRKHLKGNTVSSELGNILDKMIEFAVKKRYQSADEVLAVLTQKATTTPVVSPTVAPIIQVVLKSEKNVDYTKLRDLLATGLWKEADQETKRVMLQATGRTNKSYLDRKSIDNFPCEDLRTIDELWVKASHGRFGFSVQKQIWLKCGGKVDWETESKLADEVKWQTNGKWIRDGDVIFDLTAPPGHLPMATRSRPALGWLFVRRSLSFFGLSLLLFLGAVLLSSIDWTGAALILMLLFCVSVVLGLCFFVLGVCRSLLAVLGVLGFGLWCVFFSRAENCKL